MSTFDFVVDLFLFVADVDFLCSELRQKVAAEQKDREAKAQAAELQRLRTALEEKTREAEAQSAELQRLGTSLEQQKTDLLHKEVAVVALTGTLRE